MLPPREVRPRRWREGMGAQNLDALLPFKNPHLCWRKQSTSGSLLT